MKKMVIAALCLMLTGCAGTCNKIHRNGSLIGSTNGDWIVVKYSGGKITDVWKMHNVLVQSEDQSDGWLFNDQDGNMVNVSGDTKAIRVLQSNEEELYSKYVDYHMEFDSLTYAQRLSSPKK